MDVGRAGVVESGVGLGVLGGSGGCPCGVCLAGVGGTGAVRCGGCGGWVRGGCGGVGGRLPRDSEFTCARCLGTARAVGGGQSLGVGVGGGGLGVVPGFCYLGDMLSAGGGCGLAAVARCRCAWGGFRQLLPLLTNRQVPLLTRGRVYSSCVGSVVLHAAGTWAVGVDTLNRLRRNDRAVIRWVCGVGAGGGVSSDSLLAGLGVRGLDVVLRAGGVGWFGRVGRGAGWVSEVRKLSVVAQGGSGGPGESWDEVIKNDGGKLGVGSAGPRGRSGWRGRLRGGLVKKPNPR